MNNGLRHRQGSLLDIRKQLNLVEQLIKNKHHSQAYDRLIKILSGLKPGQTSASWQREAPPAIIEEVYHQISQNFSLLFQAIPFDLSREQYLHALRNKENIHHSFVLGNHEGYHTTLRMIEQRSMYQQGNVVGFRAKSDLYKYLLLASVRDDLSVGILIQLAKQAPEKVYHVLLLCWADQWELNDVAVINKNKLASCLLQLSEVTPSIQSLFAIQKCLAKSAYLTDQFINIHPVLLHLLRNYARSKNLKAYAEPRLMDLPLATGKPKLLLFCECFWPGHVVHRCFIELITPLREVFEVIAITNIKDYQYPPWNFCDQVITFDNDLFSIHLFIDRIVKLHPSMIIYTSLGMRLWTLVTAQLRLAPVQIVLPGHPDDRIADFEHIDYLAVGNFFSRENHKFLHYEAPGSIYLPASIDKTDVKTLGHNGPIKLGVCANIFKLNQPILTLLLNLKSHYQGEIELHVFQNLGGIEYQIGNTQVSAFLPTATVHPRYQRSKYLATLRTLDVLMGTFPFGGENSILDALSQRVPVFINVGDTISQRLDHRLITSLPGFPAYAVNQNTKDLEIHILKFLRDKNLRTSYQKWINQLDLEKIFSEECAMYKGGLLKSLLPLLD
jgi:hypothetical protein